MPVNFRKKHFKKSRRISRLIIFSFEEQQTKVTCKNIWQQYRLGSLEALKSQWILAAWQAASMTFQTQKLNAGYVRQDTDRRLDNSNCLTQYTYRICSDTIRELLFGTRLVCCMCFSLKHSLQITTAMMQSGMQQLLMCINTAQEKQLFFFFGQLSWLWVEKCSRNTQLNDSVRKTACVSHSLLCWCVFPVCNWTCIISCQIC